MAMGVVRISAFFDRLPTTEQVAGFDRKVILDQTRIERPFSAHVDVDCPTHNNSSTITSAEMSNERALLIMRASCPGAHISSVDVRQVG